MRCYLTRPPSGPRQQRNGPPAVYTKARPDTKQALAALYTRMIQMNAGMNPAMMGGMGGMNPMMGGYGWCWRDEAWHGHGHGYGRYGHGNG
ncbi:hypothetical protein NMY22_g3751 [Coprinellus aureogranulatus]|nr:hypothetical protein NMY22_g3751 [Coprinellus aureogranulatus]